jgi:Na+-transporting NADH:ubiquinone oxidoreductase subunit B
MWNVGYQHFLSVGGDSTLWENLLYGLWQVLPIVVVSYVTGLGIEFMFAQIRHHEVNEGFLVSGMLIPLVLPVGIPLWMVAVATAFAVVIGKEVFGGTGMNLLNPALTARAFLFFAYPQDMSGDKVWIADKADAFSGATPLAHAAAGNMQSMPSDFDMFFGLIPGSIG